MDILLGPYATEGAAIAACGSSGSGEFCCGGAQWQGGALPDTLYCTMTGTCMEASFPLTNFHDPLNPLFWSGAVGSFTTCDSASCILACPTVGEEPGIWQCVAGAGYCGPGERDGMVVHSLYPMSMNCDPFVMTFAGEVVGPSPSCDGGTCTIVITE